MLWPCLILAFILFLLIGFYIWFKSSGLARQYARSDIFMLHNVSRKITPAISTITEKRFNKIYSRIISRSSLISTLEQAVLYLTDSNAEKSTSFTFDDGYEDIYRIFREKFEPDRIPLTVFMVSGFIGLPPYWDYAHSFMRHLNREELNAMIKSGLVTIGAHTVNHPDLTILSTPEKKKEIVDSKKQLEDLVGQEVKYFSYPFGRFDREAVDLVREAGYQAAFGGVPTRVSDNNLFTIPRKPLNVFDNFYTLDMKIRSSRLSWMEFSKARVIEMYSALTSRVKGRNKW